MSTTVKIGSNVTVTSGDAPKLDLMAVVRRISPEITGMMKTRARKGLDVNGQPFAPYAPSTVEQYARGGESSKVDLTITGAMILGLAERVAERLVAGGRAEMLFGPGSGTSEERRLVRHRTKSGKLTTKSLGKNAWGIEVGRSQGRAAKTGERSPPHTQHAAWIHFGTERMPARPFVGLTEAEEAAIGKLIAEVALRAR